MACILVFGWLCLYLVCAYSNRTLNKGAMSFEIFTINSLHLRLCTNPLFAICHKQRSSKYVSALKHLNISIALYSVSLRQQLISQQYFEVLMPALLSWNYTRASRSSVLLGGVPSSRRLKTRRYVISLADHGRALTDYARPVRLSL